MFVFCNTVFLSLTLNARLLSDYLEIHMIIRRAWSDIKLANEQNLKLSNWHKQKDIQG